MQSWQCWLMLSDEKLGELQVTSVDMFWVLGIFHPALAFDKYCEQFEELALAWEQEGGNDPTGLLEDLNSLGFCVEDEQGQQKPICDLKIHAGRRFEFRYA